MNKHDLPEEKQTVLITGAFDIMHVGHIEILKYASTFGRVFVAIDFDSKIKEEKGPNRPFNTFQDRKKFLEAIVYVDTVIGFSSKEHLEQICQVLTPAYRIVGMDWFGKPIVGEKWCRRLRYYDRVGNHSTTRILEGIK